MSALAKLLSTQGYEVSGSDALRGEETENLAFYGVKTYIGVDGNRKELIEADMVVYTDAIPKTHDELKSAFLYGKRVLSRADLLAMISKQYARVLSVAGSHGKTTCTSMCAHALRSVGVSFTAHIGGADSEFGNFYTSGRDFFLTEACEYKRNMVKISADVGIVLNVDCDHMECYADENDLIDCFAQYTRQAKVAFVCADDVRCARFENCATFGINSVCADYRAVDLRAKNGRYAFTVEEYGNAICRVQLRAIGRCNVYNALAAFAAMRSFGFAEKEIKKGLENFKAVKRRFEKIGAYRGAELICDYAHHPREITSTILTAEEVCKGRLFVVFQPHTYSRTKLLFNDFIKALQPIKELIIFKTFPAREKFDEEGCAERLATEIGCLYAENVYVLKTWLKKTVREGDTVLFLGAGDVYYVAQYLAKEIY